MDNTRDAADRKLRRLVITVPFEERHLDRLRNSFPHLDIVRSSQEELPRTLADADAVVTWRLTAEDLAAAPKLRWFQTTGAGVDSLLIPELVARDLVITNNSGVHASNISEHILAMMLAFARQLPSLMRGQIAHEWRDTSTHRVVFDLGGQTLLVVGLGDIGVALADRAAALGMTVIGTRRRLDQPVPASVAEVVGVDELADVLPRADHVAICLPLTTRTRGLFDAAMLGRMKSNAYLYNIGRGPIVDTEALVDALRGGQLAGAGLDVTDPEPLPPDSPLWDMDNVLITAHTSGATPHYWDRAIEILAENIDRFERGEPLLNRVDPAEGY